MTNLRVFGSVARGQDRPDSDVDLLADLPPGLGLLGAAGVDLVAGTLKPAIRTRNRRRPGRPVTYRDQQRLADIQAAIDAIRSHLRRGDLTDSLGSTPSASDSWKSARPSRHCPPNFSTPSPLSPGARSPGYW